MCQNLSSIGLLVYKLQQFKWSYCCKFSNNGKTWISCVDKALLSDGEKNTVQEKQWLHKCYSDSDPLETTVKKWYADFKCGCTGTNDADQIRHLFPKTQKNSTNSFWPIVSWSCVR